METRRLCLLFLMTCLLGIVSRQVSASQPARLQEESAYPDGVSDGDKVTEGEGKKSGDGATEEKDILKEQGEKAFPVGHRIEVQVQHGSYIVEREPGTPHILTISLQMLDGEKHLLGFVPMGEVTAMLEEAKNLGSGLPQALLDSKFLAYAFDQAEAPVASDPQSSVAAKKLAEQFLAAEEEADEQQGSPAEEKRGEDDEDGEEEDEEDGEDAEEDEDEADREKSGSTSRASLRGSQ